MRLCLLSIIFHSLNEITKRVKESFPIFRLVHLKNVYHVKKIIDIEHFALLNQFFISKR